MATALMGALSLCLCAAAPAAPAAALPAVTPVEWRLIQQAADADASGNVGLTTGLWSTRVDSLRTHNA
ncbi:MAG: hypothetical protein JWN15_3703, partial [Firmicutes bacterium]|nr:hypothetical protein [Bacillota bacterium]